MSIWKEESKFDYKLYQEIDSFFKEGIVSEEK